MWLLKMLKGVFHFHQWEYSAFQWCYLPSKPWIKGGYPVNEDRRECRTCGKRQVARCTHTVDPQLKREYHSWYWMTVTSDDRWQVPMKPYEKVVQPSND